jgi:hypothetical protein
MSVRLVLAVNVFATKLPRARRNGIQHTKQRHIIRMEKGQKSKRLGIMSKECEELWGSIKDWSMGILGT